MSALALHFVGNLLGGGIRTTLVVQPREPVRPRYLLSRFPVDGLLLTSLVVAGIEQLAVSEEDGGSPIPVAAVLGMDLSLATVRPDERVQLQIKNPASGNFLFEAVFVERMPHTPGEPGWEWLGTSKGTR